MNISKGYGSNRVLLITLVRTSQGKRAQAQKRAERGSSPRFSSFLNDFSRRANIAPSILHHSGMCRPAPKNQKLSPS
ncbi:MAG: hypothetical protein H0X43_03565 [Nitrosospira sp.]|nr:hypothetical protein [Nitrosospira sp.]